MKKIIIVAALMYAILILPAPVAVQPPRSASQPVTAIAASELVVVSEMVHINGGTFQMGSDNEYDYGSNYEKPVHTVRITSFYMAKYPVTQKEWIAIMGDNPSEFKGDTLPVENVNWYEAVEYCNRLSQREGLTPVYTINKDQQDSNNKNESDKLKWTVTWNRNASGYRLPTEAEWEYAARGGNGSPGDYTYSGSNNVDEVAWYGENSAGSTQEVGTKKPNGLGLYDMSGNIGEWCWDWFDYDYYKNSPRSDPLGASSGSLRAWRGGSWRVPVYSSRSTSRFFGDMPLQRDYIGFRLVRPAVRGETQRTQSV
jgi:formylglycine-generating enzyme required for sulfatase activity